VFLLVVGASICAAIGFQMTEASLFAMISKQGGDYGKQKLWGLLARIIVPPLAGIFVELYSARVGYLSYAPCFFLWDILTVFSILCTWFMNVKPEKPPKNLFKNVVVLIKRPDVLLMLIVVFFMGMGWGFGFIYTGLHLMEMGGSPKILGLMGSVACAVSVPVLYVGDSIIDRFGHSKILLLSGFVYFGRFMAYAYLREPWFALLIEGIGETVCGALMWAAAARYADDLGGKTMRVTTQALIRMMHFYLGRSVVCLLAGIIIHYLGMRGAFLMFAITELVAVIIYYVLYTFFASKIEKRREATNRREATEEQATPEEKTPALKVGVDEKHLEDLIRQRSSSIPIET